VAIFENPALDFKNNRAEDDDILDDAYVLPESKYALKSESKDASKMENKDA